MALNTIGAQMYKWEIEGEEQHLKEETGDVNATYFPYGSLVYVRPNADLNEPAKLAWKFNVYAQQPLSRNLIFVDALSGDLLFQENLIHTADANGTAVTVYSGNRAIVADSVSPGNYRLQESGRGNGIVTKNLNLGTSYANATDFTDSDNFWNNVNSNLNQYATDAHWGAEMTYDYLWLEHNRNSINGAGFTLRSYIHADLVGFGLGTNVNAFWDGQRMTYGDGNGGSITPLTALDIAGHEIAHGLTTFSADLIYQGESGALNESFSDIFGASIEHYARPNNYNWLIGEDIGTVIRSMSNPNQQGNPDCYDGQFWNDNNGVHTNSGVSNFWYYLLVNGGSGTNDLGNAYNVSGIGYTDAGAVAFRNLTNYLSPSSNYADARFYAILSAIDLFGGCSPQVDAVTEAWYAVGVGGPYVPYTDADLSASGTESCTVPYTVDFSNLSINGTTFAWDFGDGTTSTQRNPTHTYTDTGSFTVTLIADGGPVCGADTLVLQDYIYISPTAPCNVILPASGTAATQTACSGKLYDSGGPNSNYGDGELSTITIAPVGASAIEIDFPLFDIEAGSGSTCDYDYLEIYDGNSTSAPLIGRYCNTTGNPGTITSTGGAITLRFLADAGVNNAGFEMNWSCLVPNTPPTADFTWAELNSCSGEFAFSDASTNGPVSWTWDFGDGSFSNLQNPTHRYTQNGVYSVKLTVTNSFGSDSTVQTSSVNVNLAQGPASQDTMVCQGATVNMVSDAVGAGILKWYDAQNGGNLVNTGDTLSIPSILVSDTFFVEEEIAQAPVYGGAPDNTMGGGNIFTNQNQYLIFDVLSDVTLKSVLVYSGSPGNRTIELRDGAGTVLQSKTVNIPDGEVRVDLDFSLTPGTNYQLGLNGNSMAQLYRNNSGVSYPYNTPGLVSVTRSSAGSNPLGFYYFFYDWELEEPACYSERNPVYVNVEICGGIADAGPGAAIGLYPNPVKSMVNVDLSAYSNRVFDIKVMSMLGQVLEQRQSVAGEITILDISRFAPGNYIVAIDSEGIYERRQLVIH
jgi:Zn-dependent metalloprotease